MKNLIFLISAILIFSISESSSDDYHWPFNDCYRAEFDSCSQNCTDTLTFTKLINYAGCEVKVSYKVRECYCPEPTVFSEVSDIYSCPNELTVKYFWPSECVGFCIYEMEEIVPSNPFGPLFAQIIAPMYCGGYACCGTILTYCRDAQGNISKTESYQQGPIACELPVLPACPNLDDPFELNGLLYTIIRVRGTECLPPCYDAGGGN